MVLVITVAVVVGFVEIRDINNGSSNDSRNNVGGSSGNSRSINSNRYSNKDGGSMPLSGACC